MLAPLAPTLAFDGDADAKVTAEAREQVEQRLKEAQERMETSAREMAELSLKLSGEQDEIRREVRVVMERRPQLGMSIDMRAGDAPAEGVHVASVSPGGPAEAAGVRANDVVTSLGGIALKGDARRPAGRQLLDILRGAKPGEPMPIEFRHEGKLVKARVVPTAPADIQENLSLAGVPHMGGPLADPDVRPGMRQLRLFMHDGGGFGGAELVELSPGLGSYFGTEKGLLVVRAPPDSRFKLQDGDVILDIDGRVPTGVGHAMQILGSYHAGETVKLHLMRQKQRVELAVAVPDAG
jgi:predicted metalloprotease with PDZ domain